MQKSKVISDLLTAFNLILITLLCYLANAVICTSRATILETKVEVNSLVKLLFSTNVYLIGFAFIAYASIIFFTSLIKNKAYSLIANLILIVLTLGGSLYYFVIINNELQKITMALTNN